MFGAEVSRVSGEPAPIPAYLTDKRLKIRISKLPEKVRERLYRKGYVGLMVGNTLTWTNYDMDKPFIRISLNPVLRGLMERAEGGSKKIEVKILYNRYYWAIKYEKDLDTDGNILFFIESAKELLPGYIKTSKGLILPREMYYALTNIKGIEKEIGVIKKEKSKLRHILGIEHGNIPIELDLWGNEVIFREKDRQRYTDTQDRTNRRPRSLSINLLPQKRG
jgi:hypothetical protein